MVTVTCAVAVQPFASVPVTVYEVVEDGLAVTLEPVVELKFVDGVHAYVLAPFAVSVTELPLHTAAGVFTVTTGGGFTVTVTCAAEVQPLAYDPITL